MTENKTTVQNSTVSTIEEQSCDDNFYRKMIRQMTDPSYLPTISMSELYEKVYDGKPPIIDPISDSRVMGFVR